MMAQVIDFGHARARRAGPIVHVGGRHYRVVRPELAALVSWWRELPESPASFRARLDDRPAAAVVVLRSNTQ
ncbi:MAG: hypothetical protein ACP5QO_09785 [Clostridia bacterium]